MLAVLFLVQTVFASDILSFAGWMNNDTRSIHPSTVTTPDVLNSHGYDFEEHKVITKDGYILTLFRILPIDTYPNRAKGKSVLVVHGILCSSTDFLLGGPEKGPAFHLARRGYDVWLGNCRGNIYSSQHISLDSKKAGKFWDFSFHEMGYYDLPAMIDHVLNKTGQEKIFYIAHSQGVTAFLAMAAMRPEYNSKILLMCALGPICYLGRTPAKLLKTLSFRYYKYLPLINKINPYNTAPNGLFIFAGKLLCGNGNIFQEICAMVIFTLLGWDSPQLNRTLIPTILNEIPAGTSNKQLVHFAQHIVKGEFRQYDYTLLGNLKRYGSPVPPKYLLSKVTAPVALYYGENDVLASLADTKKLIRELPNVVRTRKVGNKWFTHVDFLWAIDLIPLVYNDIFSLMDKYANMGPNSGKEKWKLS